VLALAICAFRIPASDTVAALGSLAGTGSLLLNGIDVSIAGVLSWPFVSGDELATDAAPAVILLRDSNRVFLDPRTRVRIEQRGGRIAIDLLAGELYFSLQPNFALDFQASGHYIALAGATQGALSIEKQRPLLKAGVAPPPLVLDGESLGRRFPYRLGFYPQ
jgi:FecR protein